MTIHLAGTGPFICQTPFQGGTGLTGGGGDASWVSSSCYIGNTGSTVRMIPFGLVTDGWFHWEGQVAGRGWNNNYMCSLNNAAGSSLIRVYANAVQVFVGGAWQSVGTVPVDGNLNQFDIYLKAHATEGLVEFYFNKELIGSYSGNTSAFQITQMWFGNPITFGGDTAYYSQILIADFPTLFAKVKQTLFTTAGTYADWTGTVNDIKDAIPNSNTFVTSDAVDEKATFKAAARDFTGYTIRSVIAMGLAQRGSESAPPKIRTMLRIGGADYYGPEIALSFGSKVFIDAFDTNPVSGLAWDPATAGNANLEVGFQTRP